ncbi:site-specific DNA-methyltransferase [Rathayibacter sp. AY1G1]|uniref:DNA-methyltransferase n=1 Tax=Rathayibacter sp. AY1G1 TaxID=2080564 RepID=UPI001CA4DE32|nr:site-specific DNA-methyltransferase [Rathayibacter sp. AY1G1]
MDSAQSSSAGSRSSTPSMPLLGTASVGSLESWEANLAAPTIDVVNGDARDTKLPDNFADLIVTSPPYWNKRDYGHVDQIGLEATPEAYVSSIMDCLDEWKRVLRPSGSIFLNVGDTYYRRSLVGIPSRIEAKAIDAGWAVRNRIIWAKEGGMPDPARDRLANRHEYIIHLTYKPNYYYDLVGYSAEMGNGANPGDVWTINPERNMGAHLAPYPQELVRRAVLLGAPQQVCATCGTARRRVVERTRELDTTRPQAKRAMELADAAGLTDEHIRAIQATGVSDVGKATKFQTGTGRNTLEVQRLAAEAKQALGGYFREFTFSKKKTTGWTDCGHGTPGRGVVLDPFMGTGTTLKTAASMGRDAVGVDLVPLMDAPEAPTWGGPTK